MSVIDRVFDVWRQEGIGTRRDLATAPVGQNLQQQTNSYAVAASAHGLVQAALEGVPTTNRHLASAPMPEQWPDVSKIEVGAKVGKFTQFGSVWLDLDQVAQFNLNPSDGCGAEIQFLDGKTQHFNRIGQALFLKYFEQEKAKHVDPAVKELERMAAVEGVRMDNGS